MTSSPRHLVWRQLHWRRPLDVLRVTAVLRQWATDTRSPLVILEARAGSTGVNYFIGAPIGALTGLVAALHDLTGSTASKLGEGTRRVSPNLGQWS